MTEDEPDSIEDAVWALVFFGIGSIIFMNRTATNATWIILAGSVSFIFGCAFVFRFLVKPRR
jgi:hypothetical protein